MATRPTPFIAYDVWIYLLIYIAYFANRHSPGLKEKRAFEDFYQSLSLITQTLETSALQASLYLQIQNTGSFPPTESDCQEVYNL